MMLKTGKYIAIFALVAAALTGCGESDNEIARKGGLIDKIVPNSLAKCDLQRKFNSNGNYEQRLRTVLNTATSKALDVIIENNITVCMDQRLYRQETGFWSTETFGAYYKPQKVLTLWDNGLNSEKRGLLESNNTSWSSEVLDDFAEAIQDNDNDIKKSFSLAGLHSIYVNGVTTFYIDWDDGSDYDYELKRNPALRMPPLAAARPGA